MSRRCTMFLAACVILGMAGCGGGGGGGGGGGAAVFPAGAAIERVSVSSGDTQGNDWSPGSNYLVSLSGDGRYAAFNSAATNLAANDTNGQYDVFVRDRLLGQTSRVNVSSGGTEANDHTQSASISWDGRYVAFDSSATNLVPDDTNSVMDVFIHDRLTGQTSRASVSSGGAEGNGSSYYPSLSGNGRYLAFASQASNLVPDHINGTVFIYVRDLKLGLTSRVDVSSGGTQGNDLSTQPSISADGRFVAFHSHSTNLVPDDTNAVYDVFVHDRQTGETSRVSVSSGGTQADSDSQYASISADGRYVAFESYASNLVADDTNARIDVFLHDRQTGVTTRVSVTSAGAQGSGTSCWPSISADGRYVVFVSDSQLDPAATLLVLSLYVHDNVTGVTALASKNASGGQNNGSAAVVGPAISANGNYVLFASSADNLVANDTNAVSDVFAAPNPARP
jgi:Tol biopolymer transport system component